MNNDTIKALKLALLLPCGTATGVLLIVIKYLLVTCIRPSNTWIYHIVSLAQPYVFVWLMLVGWYAVFFAMDGISLLTTPIVLPPKKETRYARFLNSYQKGRGDVNDFRCFLSIVYGLLTLMFIPMTVQLLADIIGYW